MSQARSLGRARLRAAWIALFALLPLGACTGQETAWLFGPKARPPGPPIAALEQDATVWCYRTLAQADCYATEQPQYATRLLGAFIRTGGELVPVAQPTPAAPVIPAAERP